MTSFSVVVPLHNKGPHVERAIRSVLNQITPAAEIIVIDDASTDDGVEIVKAISSHKIKLISRTNPGPGGYAARNAGIKAASGDWIAFLDADDNWELNHLSEATRLIKSLSDVDNLVGIFSGYRLVYDEKQVLDPASRRKLRPDYYEFKDFVELWLKLGWCPIWTSASIFKRDELLKSALFPESRCKRGGDKDLWLRLASQGAVAFTGQVTATYYKDSVNMVTKSTKVNLRPCICDTILELIEKLPDKSDGLKRLFNSEILTTLKSHLG